MYIFSYTEDIISIRRKGKTMAKAKNKVIAGDNKGKSIQMTFGQIAIAGGISLLKPLFINSETVEAYELVTDEHKKSAASGIARGLVGGALLGGVGMIVGANSAKEKGIYQVAIQFKDGKKSLIEIDDNIYKQLIKSCF